MQSGSVPGMPVTFTRSAIISIWPYAVLAPTIHLSDAPFPERRRPDALSPQEMKQVAQHAGSRAPDEKAVIGHGIERTPWHARPLNAAAR